MTNVSHRVFLAVFFAFCLLTASVAQQPNGTSKGHDVPSRDNDSISVTSFGNRKVVGLLGYSLGTVVRVTGVAVDGDDTRSKADAGKLLLSVETVNGAKLSKPAVFEFLRASRKVVKPTPGDDFDYYVHEYGEFDGVVEPPIELGIDVVVVAHDGFHYRPHITIHKSLK